VVNKLNLNLGSVQNLELVKQIFAAKQVPLLLLGRIRQYREFHRPDWPAVVAATSGQLQEFDFYFDFVVAQVEEHLKSLWVE
jgi:hypothetical protein